MDMLKSCQVDTVVDMMCNAYQATAFIIDLKYDFRDPAVEVPSVTEVKRITVNNNNNS